MHSALCTYICTVAWTTDPYYFSCDLYEFFIGYRELTWKPTKTITILVNFVISFRHKKFCYFLINFVISFRHKTVRSTINTSLYRGILLMYIFCHSNLCFPPLRNINVKTDVRERFPNRSLMSSTLNALDWQVYNGLPQTNICWKRNLMQSPVKQLKDLGL